MDNKEKVRMVYDELVSLVNNDRAGFVTDYELRANLILDILKPTKVKLPKAAYEWMEERKGCRKTSFGDCVLNLERNAENYLFSTEFNKFCENKESVFLLVDAYRYGYELEETEEERIKRGIREILKMDVDDMIDNELIHRIYKIARGENNA